MNVSIYSDIVCPWCYVGEHRFRRAVANTGIPVQVTFRPFQLNPDATNEPRPVLEYLRERFGPQAEAAHDNVARMAAQEGLPFLAGEQLLVSTLEAHRLLGFALQEYGRDIQGVLMQRLFEAHFAERANVANVDTLVSLAERAGMDPTRSRTWLMSGEGRPELQTELGHAIGLGVRAVPTFVFAERYALQGAQPVETFAQVLQQVAAELAKPHASRSVH